MLVAGIHSSSAEALITAQDYAVDSDVVLESALREIKSAPRDTVNVIGDSLKYASDETVTAAKGVAAVFKGSPHEKAQRAGELAVEDAWLTSDEILFRSYKVSDDVGHDLMQGADVPEGEAADVSAFFTGMNLPKGASVIYRPEFNKLFVRQTMENMMLIEDTLADNHNASRELLGHQIEIETKFVEVSQSTLNELGFDWTFGSKYGGAANIFENLTLPAGTDLLTDALRTAGRAAGGKTAAFGAAVADSDTLVLSKSAGSLQWSLIINALEQAEDSDVLSAPSIVTRDGNTATIMVGEDRMVPKRFGTSTRNSAVYVEHSDWEQQLMGVTLQVRPELRTEGLIDLDLKPKVIDLIGYDNYQISPTDENGTRDAAMWPIQNNRLDISGKQGRYPIVSNAGRALGGVYDGIVKTLDDTWGNGGDPNMITNYVGQLGTANQSYQVGSGYFDTFRELDKDEMIQIPALNGQLPYFRLREMQTRVTVEDGSTVGMGGLIYDKLETFRDKVPVLGSIPLIGRLFRSEGEKSIKRNLMIFVTATQVDINGRKASDLALNQ
jgi:general secretion pathway protein D